MTVIPKKQNKPSLTLKVKLSVPLKLALLGVEQFSGRKSTSRTYLHTATKTLAEGLRVEAGWTDEFEGSLVMPEGAQLSDNTDPGRVCWIVGVTAEIPGWPDLEVAREVKVV